MLTQVEHIKLFFSTCQDSKYHGYDWNVKKSGEKKNDQVGLFLIPCHNFSDGAVFVETKVCFYSCALYFVKKFISPLFGTFCRFCSDKGFY